MSDPTPEERAYKNLCDAVRGGWADEIYIGEELRSALRAAESRVRAAERLRIADLLEAEAPKWQACSHAVSFCATKVREDLRG